MSMRTVVGGRLVVHVFAVVAVTAGVLALASALDAALAQAGPLGVSRPQALAAPVGGVLGWIFVKQAEFYRQFSSLIRAAKADGTAAWSLFALSFLYGIFHAAGPGHGKAVISSYMVANEETWTRGVVLSFASALLQALVAVVVVGIAAGLLNATAATMNRAVNAIEIVSYSLIVLIGLRLLWVKGRAFIAALHSLHRPAAVGAAVTPVHHHHSHHDEAQHGHRAQAHHGHDHGHDHARSTILSTTTAVVGTRITVIMTTTPRPGDTLMRWSRKSWPGREAGSAACPRSSQSACGRAQARSSCWSLPWRRDCSGPVSSRHS